MSFRRSKEAARDARRWRTFLDQNRAQLEESALPRHIYESRDFFDDFLMHGCIDHHARPYDFSIRQLTKDQALVLREVVVRYLAAGFGDPGLALFDSEEHEAIRGEAERRLKEET
jgi:hypothetical protein